MNPSEDKKEAAPPCKTSAQSPCSCMSLKSDQSKDFLPEFKQHHTDQRDDLENTEYPSGQCVLQDQEHLDSVFKHLEEKIVTFVKNELKRIQKVLISENQEGIECQDSVALVDEEQRKDNREAFMNIILHFLRGMKHDKLADCMQSRLFSVVCQRKLKAKLKKKFQYVFEGFAKAENPTLLNQIFTELYITDRLTGEAGQLSDVTEIETASRKPYGPEVRIKHEDIFNVSPERNETARTVMTKGVAGIGKTVLTQKFTLDWADDKVNHHIQFTFSFTFRELNVLQDREFSLLELVYHFYPEVKEAGICRFEGLQVVFIFDGLDESRLTLDFQKHKILTDVTESTSLDVLLTNLIRGDLLPSARLWITTRPAAANQIPPEYVDMMTEIRGFADLQKEEYFTKKIRDDEQASRIITHIKTSRSLHIMCHIPVFCWITATVLEEFLKTSEGGELPKTLTEMYIHFLVVQTKRKMIKYDGGAETDPLWSPKNRKMVESLAKLAFEQLLKGNLIFYESDLRKSGIDIGAASQYSGVFTQIFKKETGMCQGKMFSFVHLSVQEFLAALHVHLTYINSGVNLLVNPQKISKKSRFAESYFYKSAVRKALGSPNGHLDQFLRFLLGISMPNNQRLLRGLLKQTESNPQTNKETIQYIKEKINDSLSVEKSLNLFHCLNELSDHSLVEEIQHSLARGHLCTDKLSPAQWSALVFILLSSEEDLDVFDLKKYSALDKALLRLLPVVKASSTALLSFCNLSERSLEALSSVLSSQSSCLRKLDLTSTNLQDSGVTQLLPGLGSPNCALQSLRMSTCNLSRRTCEYLSSVLRSKFSNLRELDLSNNDLQDLGVKLLSGGVENPDCRLETLSLSGCMVSKEGCTSLASALSSNHSCLKELDLSYNHPEDLALKPLLAGLEDPSWRLETLRVEPGGVQWLRPGLRKYSCKLTLDNNTINKWIKLSGNNKDIAYVAEVHAYPDHSDRFEFWCPQLLCKNRVTGRAYWEVQWSGRVYISVSYGGIKRKGNMTDCLFGWNDQSWSLMCSDDGYSVWHNGKATPISSSSISDRVAVYVDYAAGILSFYRVSSDSLIHLHTFNTTFTESPIPGFGFWSGWSASSLSLCSSC